MKGWLLCLLAAVAFSAVESAGAGAARLVCYVEGGRNLSFSECTHLVYTGDAREEKLDVLLKEYRKNNPRLKIVLRVAESDKDLRYLLKSKQVQGLEIYDAHRSFNKTKVVEIVEAAKKAVRSSGSGPLFLALPSQPELLAKYYDLRALVKVADLMMLQTHNLGGMKKTTYHPSRLSGMWDMMNTDSAVDLAIGLGVPASKIVISLPALAKQFTLLNETLSTPGSPSLEEEPKDIDRAELCRMLTKGKWTLERDQDLSAPYAFNKKTWISFEDASSIDVKGKYARVRGLAGLALYGADTDVENTCGSSLKTVLSKVLNQQIRAPRAVVLRTLEEDILSAPRYGSALEALQVSPYRITQLVDTDGVIHSIREDTRTEFTCSRQGYFVHPRSCARFYRCVKFDQLSSDYTVFEFDCPSGLAFDARHEVCVWPGSISSSQACPGTAEIAPVPRARFQCPANEGYFADPENCRWFFACLDHGSGKGLSAYEFRCPFGLGFDAARLKCDWPWLVPECGNIGRYEAEAFGFSGGVVGGAAGFRGQTADAINVAAHRNLVSGASLNNLVGVQGGRLTNKDALDANFITSQEFSNKYSQGVSNQRPNSNFGFSQPANYRSGSLILDEYRLPSSKTDNDGINQGAFLQNSGQSNGYSSSYTALRQQDNDNLYDDSGAYVHDPTGDNAAPYKHTGSPIVPYSHINTAYEQSNDDYDNGRYSGFSGYQDDNKGKYEHQSGGEYNNKYQENNGQFTQNNYGSYLDGQSNGAYIHDDSGKYIAGVYRTDGPIGSLDYNNGFINNQQYSSASSGAYFNNAKAYTGLPHTLTAGAINVGLVGKTTLVENDYADQRNYNQNVKSDYFNQQILHPGHVSYVPRPAVAINHIGTDSHNLDGYGYVTAPTTSGIPTTSIPIAVTTALPPVVTTYRTTYVPQPPRSSLKQILGISQPAVTYVRPTVIAATPKAEFSGYNFVNEGNAVTQAPFLQTDSGVSHQIVHRVEGINGLIVNQPNSVFTEYTTAQPPIVSNYQPQIVDQPTLHTVDFSKVNAYYASDYSYQNQGLNLKPIKTESEGYNYPKPNIHFEDGISLSTPAPTPVVLVSTIRPEIYAHNHQTFHNVYPGYDYSTPKPITEEPFKKVVAYTTGPAITTFAQPTISTVHNIDENSFNIGNGYSTYSTPQTITEYTTAKPSFSIQPTVSTYVPQVYGHQTIHNVETNRVNNYQPYEVIPVEKSIPVDSQPAVSFQPAVSTYQPQVYNQQTFHDVGVKQVFVEQPEVTQYTTARPIIPVQPTVETYQPQIYNQQTLHNVDTNKIRTYLQNSDSGEVHKSITQFASQAPTEATYSTTPSPIILDYKPQSYSQQTIHKIDTQQFIPVSTTPAPILNIAYQQPSVSLYENPLVQYSKPKITPANILPIFQHGLDQGFNYQYETRKNIGLNEGLNYYQPEIQREESLGAGIKFSDASLVSHQFYHQSNDEIKKFNNDLSFISTTPKTLIFDHTEKPNLYLKANNDDRETNYYQSHSVVSSTAPTFINEQPSVSYPIQDEYDYKPAGFSNEFNTVQEPAREQVSFSTYHNEEPRDGSFHTSSFPGTSVVTKYDQIGYQSPSVQTLFENREYFTPAVSTESPIVTSSYRPVVTSTYGPIVTSTYRPIVTSTYGPAYSPVPTTREYLPPAKEPEFSAPESLPPKEEETYLPPSSTPRPIITTQRPIFVESTTFQAPEYLPPLEETNSKVVNFDSFGLQDVDSDSKISNNPYQDYANENDSPVLISQNDISVARKHNIVVETAKSNLLGFGTVGPDAGLVSPVTYSTTASPVVISSTEYFSTPKVTTYSPVRQELVEVTPSTLPVRTEPKVAVVTKINDYNPLLIRKLGAVCSCQSPVIVLKGRRPNIQTQQDYEDYSNGYNLNSGRGDIGESEIPEVSARLRLPAVETIQSSTFNPIIVPDDSYYDDYQESREFNLSPKSKEIYSENYVSSTPTIFSSTPSEVTIRPRSKVTVAPSYETILVNKDISPIPVSGSDSLVQSQSFDRYGPGGWRGRDETLQGSVDCQRAGLFRHPKHCNKFYACRWDTTKQRFTLHIFNCPVQLSFDSNIGACNWPSQGPACQSDTLITNAL